MRSLAQYIMKGRTEAVLTVIFSVGSVFFAWIGAAAVALVTLRKGPKAGSQLLLWGMVPAVVLAAIGDTSPVTTLLGVFLVAVVLRGSASWPWALLAAVMSGVITALVLLLAGAGYIEQIIQMVDQFLQEFARQASDEVVVPSTPNALQIAGLLGLSNAFTVVVCALLGRWWQAQLYNPGGFQQEFHSLRLPPTITVLLLVVGLGISMLGPDYRLLAVIFALPLMVAGFALVHGLVARRGLGRGWLVLCYSAWLLFDPLKALLLLAAVADSWLHFRARLAAVKKD